MAEELYQIFGRKVGRIKGTFIFLMLFFQIFCIDSKLKHNYVSL